MNLHNLNTQLPQVSPNIETGAKITLKDGVNFELLFNGANGIFNFRYIFNLAKKYGFLGDWVEGEDVENSEDATDYLNSEILRGCSIQWDDDVWITRDGYDIETGEIDDETSEEPEPFTVHATLCTSNFGGIELEISDCGDGVRYRHNYGDGKPGEIFEAEIVYRPNEDLDGTSEDDGYGDYPCFIAGEGENETVYFLADFMRV